VDTLNLRLDALGRRVALRRADLSRVRGVFDNGGVEPQRKTIGDVFPPTDPLGQWIVVAHIGLNDLAVADNHLHGAREAGSQETSFYFRLVCAHTHELSLHFKNGRKRQEINSFLKQIGAPATKAERFLARVESALSPARQGVFHYPKPGSQELANALRTVAKEPAGVGVDPNSGAVRFLFCDVVADAYAFPDVWKSDKEFRRLIPRIQKAHSDFIAFAKLAIMEYTAQRGMRIADDEGVPFGYAS
jgi:hypothetical protein